MQKVIFHFVLTAIFLAPGLSAKPLVIAHRGASGYLPEHTLAGAAFAYASGADYIEPDLVLTKDGIAIVLHDIHLEQTTNVENVFPARKRGDGRWYAMDFTLAEVKTLRVHERTDSAGGKAVFPERYPMADTPFTVPTFEELITLIGGLNKSTGRQVGIYPEIKAPTFHKAAGFDIVKIVIEVLGRHHLNQAGAKVFLQCFDPQALIYAKEALKSPLPRVQLIGENEWHEAEVDYTAMRTEAGIKAVARYASAIGPSLSHLFSIKRVNGKPVVTPSGLAKLAHQSGLLVHPYTIRSDQLPEGVTNLDQYLKLVFAVGGADGVFTDFTDLTVAYLAKTGKGK